MRVPRVSYKIRKDIESSWKNLIDSFQGDKSDKEAGNLRYLLNVAHQFGHIRRKVFNELFNKLD